MSLLSSRYGGGTGGPSQWGPRGGQAGGFGGGHRDVNRGGYQFTIKI